MTTHVLFAGTTAGLARYALRDGGWQRETTALEGQTVHAIAAVGDAIMLANVGGAAYTSFDGGATWQPSSAAPPQPTGTLVATAKGPQPLANPRLAGATAYARLGGKAPMLLGAGAGGTMLFRSSDDGIHWEPAGMSETVGKITSIIPATDQANAAWAGSDQGALLCSEDAGQNWHVVFREDAPVLCVLAVHVST